MYYVYEYRYLVGFVIEFNSMKYGWIKEKLDNFVGTYFGRFQILLNMNIVNECVVIETSLFTCVHDLP